MRIPWLAKGAPKGRLAGAVSVSGLPPHRGLTLNVCFYRVPGPDAPAPFDGDPPAEAARDCHEVYSRVDLETELPQADYELPFTIERPSGFYYLAIRAILFRAHQGEMFAQAEQFFFSRRPLEVPGGREVRLMLPVVWPSQSLDELHHYGTVHPSSEGGA